MNNKTRLVSPLLGPAAMGEDAPSPPILSVVRCADLCLLGEAGGWALAMQAKEGMQEEGDKEMMNEEEEETGRSLGNQSARWTVTVSGSGYPSLHVVPLLINCTDCQAGCEKIHSPGSNPSVHTLSWATWRGQSRTRYASSFPPSVPAHPTITSALPSTWLPYRSHLPYSWPHISLLPLTSAATDQL